MEIRKIFAAGMLAFILFLFVIFITSFGHAASAPTVTRTNQFGAVIEYRNPNAYLYGNIVEGQLLGKDKTFTNVRFQPSHVFVLYTETVLFCGNQSSKFNGVTGPIVVTYHKVARSSYQGVACHDLISVDKVGAVGGE